MRPKLKIGPLTQLQDARSSAAVGFDLLSFSLERGSMKKLAPATVWNIVNWIQGPKIMLELNAESLDELAETNKMFQPHLLSFPIEDWKNKLPKEVEADIYFICPISTAPEEISKTLEEVEATGHQAYAEVSLGEISELGPYQSILPKLFLHFTQADTLFEYLQSEAPLPYGFALGNEFREDADYLDYEKIDDLIEIIESTFPED